MPNYSLLDAKDLLPVEFLFSEFVLNLISVTPLGRALEFCSLDVGCSSVSKGETRTF